MKIAGMNITFRHFPFQTFLDCMDQQGIKSIELWAGEPHLYVYRNALGNIRNIRKELKARDMEIVCFTPEQCVYPYNIAAADSHLRKASVDYFIENAYAALELGTNMMLITSGIGDFSVSREESWKYASDSIYQLTKIAETEGLTLALEPLTRFESNLITNLQDLEKMINEMESPALTGMIDTVAMQLAGETPDDYFTRLSKISHFHLIDGDGQTDAHLGLGDGLLPWSEYLYSLQKNDYDGFLTLEIMGSHYYQNPQDAIKKSIKKVKDVGIISS